MVLEEFQRDLKPCGFVQKKGNLDVWQVGCFRSLILRKKGMHFGAKVWILCPFLSATYSRVLHNDKIQFSSAAV